MMIAVIVAPLLALLAWFAVGKMIGDRAAPPEAGQAYPLIAKSNCRYPSGQCDLQNKDLTLSLRFVDAKIVSLLLTSSHALDSVIMSVTEPGNDPGPVPMEAMDEKGLRWRVFLSTRPTAVQTIRLVAGRKGVSYFAETETLFLQESDAPWTNP
ncbi:MAG: hypothetical protein Cons2KO_24960 [Congregibacter sp.]